MDSARGSAMGHAHAAAAEPLPVLRLAACSTDVLLTPLLRACHRHRGLVLFELSTAQQMSAVVVASREPAAADALHRLARKLTKAHMRRLGEHSYALHPHTDELSDWMQPGSGRPLHSRLLISRAADLGEHLDCGLFNIVVGSVHDLSALQLSINGGMVGLGSLLPQGGDDDGRLLALVLPGYTLQCIDPRTPAIPHSVASAGAHAPRTTIVLQWRLSPLYELSPGVALGTLLAQFETSVREQAQLELEEGGFEAAEEAAEEAAAAARRVAEYEPTTAPDPQYEPIIRTFTRSSIRTTVQAHLDWSVDNLKWKIYTEVEAIAYEDQRVIWDGQQLQDDRTLGQYGIPKEAVLHAVGRLRGD